MGAGSRDNPLDDVFLALADPTRRAILARLSTRDATVGELARPFDISRPAISKHLDVLERAGLVHRVRQGRENRCCFDSGPLREAYALMARYDGQSAHSTSTLPTFTVVRDDDAGLQP